MKVPNYTKRTQIPDVIHPFNDNLFSASYLCFGKFLANVDTEPRINNHETISYSTVSTTDS